MIPLDTTIASSSSLLQLRQEEPLQEGKDFQPVHSNSLLNVIQDRLFDPSEECAKSLGGRSSLAAVEKKIAVVSVVFSKEEEFFSALYQQDVHKLDSLLKTRSIPQSLLYLGLKTAFDSERLEEFKLICNFLVKDILIFEELFYLEIAREGSVFLPFLVTQFPLTQMSLSKALDIAVLHRNFSAIHFISTCEIDRYKLLSYLVKAIDDYDFPLGVLLYALDMADPYRRPAFMRACNLENMEFIKQFVSMGIHPVFMGEAFLDAIYEKKERVAFLLVNLGLHTSFIDLGLEFLAIEADENLFFSLLDCGPSRAGIVQAFFSASSVGEVRIVARLLERCNFSAQEIYYAQRLAFSHDHHELANILQSPLEPTDFLGEEGEVHWESVDWTVDLSKISTDPFRFLSIWNEFDPKPHSIRFFGEDGFGEGLTREFYSKLCEALFEKMFDEEGYPKKGDFATVSFNHLGSLLSWMLDHDLKMGKLFHPRWLKILQFTQSTNGFIRACFPVVYSNVLDASKLQRSKIYRFLNTPDEKNRLILLDTFPQDIHFLGFEVLPVIEQKKIAKQFLIEKFGDRCLIDFLEGTLDEAPEAAVFKEIAQTIISTCYGESMEDLGEIMDFCAEVRRDFWKKALKIFKASKIFLQACSLKLLEMICLGDLAPLEGEPLENLQHLKIEYSGSDQAILEKISLLKKLILEKCLKKEEGWLKNFLCFIGGGAGYTTTKPLRILEIPKENYPQSQTCFFLLKLAKGYDAYPKSLPDWEKRFLSKLEEAIQVKGYQLEEPDL